MLNRRIGVCVVIFAAAFGCQTSNKQSSVKSDNSTDSSNCHDIRLLDCSGNSVGGHTPDCPVGFGKCGPAPSDPSKVTAPMLVFSRDLRPVDGDLKELTLTRNADGSYDASLRTAIVNRTTGEPDGSTKVLARTLNCLQFSDKIVCSVDERPADGALSELTISKNSDGTADANFRTVFVNRQNGTPIDHTVNVASSLILKSTIAARPGVKPVATAARTVTTNATASQNQNSGCNGQIIQTIFGPICIEGIQSCNFNGDECGADRFCCRTDPNDIGSLGQCQETPCL